MSKSESEESGTPVKRGCFSKLLSVFLWSLYLATTAWAFGAIYSDGPYLMGENLILAVPWVVATLSFLIFVPQPGKRFVVWALCMTPVIVPWILKKPSNERNWAPEWAQTGWAEIKGDEVTIHNVRNFDWNLDGTFQERWESRTYHLSNLKGLDYFHDAFSGDLMAHPILSFDFGKEGRVCLSIETRREVGERFSMVGGFYKMTELQYLFGDERDHILVRTNIRDEPVYLYRTKFDQKKTVETFLESIRAMNDLKENPRWYNVVTNNCTTSIRAQTPVEKRAKFDFRILKNGRLDELVFERGGIVSGDLTFEELRKKSLINKRAQSAQDDPDFSDRIREGLPDLTAE